MNERIRKLRKEYLHMTLEEFGEQIGLKKSALSLIENGKNTVTDCVFKSICREFHVNEEWLKNGIGDWKKITPNSAIEQLRQEYHLSNLEYSLFSEYLKLSKENRSIFQEYFYNVFLNLTDEKPNKKFTKKQHKKSFTPISTELSKENTKATTTQSPDIAKLSIDEKVKIYRQELEREEKVTDKSAAS